MLLLSTLLVSKFWLICGFYLFRWFKTSISQSNRTSSLSDYRSEASSISSSRSRISSSSISCVGNICQDGMQDLGPKCGKQSSSCLGRMDVKWCNIGWSRLSSSRWHCWDIKTGDSQNRRKRPATESCNMVTFSNFPLRSSQTSCMWTRPRATLEMRRW